MSHVDDGTLHAYLDGELSPPEAQAVEAHVTQCPACRERLEEERALIARATELLARATPPDRELPPFRPGDMRPPVRLWWQVRLPLAWAATIALALGIGTYVGEQGGIAMRREAPSDRPVAVAGRLAPSDVAPARDSIAAEERQSRADSHVRAAKRPTPLPTVGALPDEKAKQEGLAQASADTIKIRGSSALNVARESTPMIVDGQRMAAKAAAREPSPPPMMRRVDGGYVIMGGPIGLDSARMLLGQEPLVLPNVPIRSIYRGRMIGYSGMVIIKQALDSSTVIEVINARPASLQLGAVVVSGQAAARADALARPAPTPKPESPAVTREEADRVASNFWVDVRGPLSSDSLAVLRRLLRPLRP